YGQPRTDVGVRTALQPHLQQVLVLERQNRAGPCPPADSSPDRPRTRGSPRHATARTIRPWGGDRRAPANRGAPRSSRPRSPRFAGDEAFDDAEPEPLAELDVESGGEHVRERSVHELLAAQ